MARNKAWFFEQNKYTMDLSPRERKHLERSSTALRLKKRQKLWDPGDDADRVFFVRSGFIKISRITPVGRDLTLHLVSWNEICGESSLVSVGRRASTACAYEDSLVYAVPASLLITAMHENRTLSMKFTKLLVDRRHAIESRMQSLVFKTAPSRLASLLLDLSEKFGVKDARGVIINLQITHRELASLIGTSRETVSFVLPDMRRDGLILTGEKRVILVDIPRLQQLAAS